MAKKAWYIVQAYSGFELHVKRALEERIKVANAEEQFGKILVHQRTSCPNYRQRSRHHPAADPRRRRQTKTKSSIRARRSSTSHRRSVCRFYRRGRRS